MAKTAAIVAKAVSPKAPGLLLAVLAFLAFPARADPYVGYVYPAGVQAGTTNVLLVGGQALWGNEMGAVVSGEGVRVLEVKQVPNFPQPIGTQRQYLNKWIDSIAAGVTNAPPLTNDLYLTEWHSNKWYQALNTLTRQEISLVERFLNVRRNPLQMSPSLREMRLVKIVVDADAGEGTRDFSLWSESGMSAPHPFLVTKAPHFQEPLYVPPRRPQPAPRTVTQIPCALDGQILPGETDRFTLVLEKGRRFVCAVWGRELKPYVGDAVPGYFNPVVRLVDAAGKEIAFADDHYFHPDPVLECEVPATGFYTLEVRDNLFRGREDFVYCALCSYGEAPSANACPGEAFELPKDGRRRHALKVSGPCVKRISVKARAEGSPMDASIAVFDEDGRKLASCDDVTNRLFVGTIPQAELDPVLECAFPGEGEYEVEVADLLGRGGEDYRYRLEVADALPDFEVYAAKSSFALRNWGRSFMPVHVVRRGGFSGPITLVSDKTKVRLDDANIPAGTNTWNVALFCHFTNELPVCEFKVYAVAEIGGKPEVRRVVPCDDCDQAFAWTHLVPARTFRLKPLRSPKAPPKKVQQTKGNKRKMK